MAIPERGRFKLQVGSFGTVEFSFGTKTLKDDSPLRVWRRMVRACIGMLLRDPQQESLFMYHLACTILHELEGFDKKQLMADIKKGPEFDGAWGPA